MYFRLACICQLEMQVFLSVYGNITIIENKNMSGRQVKAMIIDTKYVIEKIDKN